MNNQHALSKKLITCMLVSIAGFAILFQLGHARRQNVAALERDGNRAVDVLLLGRAYAQAHENTFPVLDKVGGHFTMPPEVLPKAYSIAPRFTTKTTTLPDALLLGNLNHYKAYTLSTYTDLEEYLYTGYAVASEREGLALINAIRNGASVRGDIQVHAGDGTLGSDTLYALRLSLEKVLAHDGVTQGEDPATLRRFPVLIGPRRDGHAWVVFLDQHVERLPYPGAFPLSQSFVTELEAGMR